jgi:ornithine cyclodeaminase
MLVLSHADVVALLDLDALVDGVAAALVAVSEGNLSMPPRVAAYVPDRDALLAAMPAHVPAIGALTTKLVSVFPHNTMVPTHQAVLCCFDPDTGTPTAVMDATVITAARTAAGSALATRHLARTGAHTVAIIGTGVQARSHAAALTRVLAQPSLVFAGRSASAAAALAGEFGGAAASMEDAVRRAEVVCATTHAAAPVVRREWLRPGTHVNSVGYNVEGDGEVDAATVRDAYIVVESRSAALAPPPAGAVELRGMHDVDAELGEIVAGTRPGRTDDEQLTLYKSVGVAAEDAAAAMLVLAAARAAGAGVEVDL